MTQRRRDPLFFERQVYQQRRLGDAARFIPFVGTFLFLLPILWAGSARTAGSGVYLFAIWACLILLVAVVSRRLLERDTATSFGETREDEAD